MAESNEAEEHLDAFHDEQEYNESAFLMSDLGTMEGGGGGDDHSDLDTKVVSGDGGKDGDTSDQLHTAGLPQQKSDLPQDKSYLPLHDEVDDDHTEVHVPRRVRKQYDLLPWLCKPLPNGPEWLSHNDEPPAWMALFFDLVIVAILSVFREFHGLTSAADIPHFFSFFIIVIWLWISQMHYDVRYEGHDQVHRLFKAAQLTIYVYMGQSSAAWDLRYLRRPTSFTDLSADQWIKHKNATGSFKTIVIAYTAYRALLCFQYLLAAYSGRKVGRDIVRQSMDAAVLFASGVCTAISLSVPATSTGRCIVKIVFLYLAVIVEIVLIWIPSYHDHPARRRHLEAIADRHGGFTIALLGEAFIGLVMALGQTSLSASDEFGSEVEVFYALMIIYVLWAILFGSFRKTDVIRSVTAATWEALHVPIYFGIMLLVVAIINNVTASAYLRASQKAIDYIVDAVSSLTTDEEPLGDTYMATISRFFARFPDIAPSFEETYAGAREYLEENPPQTDAQTVLLKWAGLSFLGMDRLWAIDPSEDTRQSVTELLNISAKYREDRENVGLALSLCFDVTSNNRKGMVAAIYWLFPTAGGLLLLSGIRSAVRYRFDTWRNILVHGLQFTMGMGLCLLTLLNISNNYSAEQWQAYYDKLTKGENPRKLYETPMLQLISNGQYPLLIVGAAYLVVALGSMIILRIHGNRNKIKGVVSRSRN